MEGLDSTLLWVTAHTHLNKQLSHVVMREETTERRGSATASWRHARDAKSPCWPKARQRVPLWMVAGVWARGLRWIAACAHPLSTEDKSQQRTSPDIQDHQHAAGESAKD